MRFSALLAFTDGDGWHPGIGDPTVVGWLTVVAYAVAAVLCVREAVREREERSRFLFWAIAGGTMVLLGINKQLDLQTWLTLTGRRLARAEGWYEKRRAVQFLFIVLIALGGLAAFGGMWRMVHDFGEDLWLPLVGMFLVICFVIMRAASFHHIDELLRTRLAGFKMNWIFELGAISVLIAGALRSGNQRDDEPDEKFLQDA
jgi:hypothetical protein